MKRNITRIIIGACLALCVIAGMTFSPVSAQKETDFQSTSGGGRLDGTWNVELTARNCTTGAPIRTLPETNTFMFGGTMVNTTSGVAPSRRNTGQGIWNHLGEGEYSFSFKAFTFDANGVYTGWQIVRQTVTLDSRASEYTSRGTLEIYDTAGNQIGAGCSTTTATRFE